jgi:hypothetical protein
MPLDHTHGSASSRAGVETNGIIECQNSAHTNTTLHPLMHVAPSPPTLLFVFSIKSCLKTITMPRLPRLVAKGIVAVRERRAPCLDCLGHPITLHSRNVVGKAAPRRWAIIGKRKQVGIRAWCGGRFMPDRTLQCLDMIYDNNGKSVDSRETCHWSHACSLEANMRGIQWHPRVQNPVEKRTTYATK